MVVQFEEDTGGGKTKSKATLTEVSEIRDRAELTVVCDEHGEVMEQVGNSERGIPNYFCPHGCKLEVGVGRVKKLFEDKGYGFLKTEGEDVFFHFSNLNGTEPVEKGDDLKFRIGYNPVSDKLQAVKLERLNQEPREEVNNEPY